MYLFSFSEIFSFILLPFILATMAFLLLMFVLKRKNFDSSNKPKLDKQWRNLSDDLRSKEMEFHKKATYKAFELYIKILLGVLGGIAYITLSAKPDHIKSKVLIQTGGYAIFPLTLLFCALIISHQKSKIERWKKGFEWYEPLTWIEYWFTSVSITVMISINYLLIPRLING